jgi:hypothetical protein
MIDLFKDYWQKELLHTFEIALNSDSEVRLNFDHKLEGEVCYEEVTLLSSSQLVVKTKVVEISDHRTDLL